MRLYPSPRYILVMMAVVLVTVLIVANGLGYYSRPLGLLAGEAAILCLTLFFARRFSMPSEDLLLLNATRLPVLGLAALVALGSALALGHFSSFFNQLLQSLGWAMPLHYQRELLEVGLARSWPELLWLSATVGFVPGLCEEIFFRGLVFTGLYVHWGPRSALVGSALLFALVHPYPWQFPALFLFGLLLGLLVYWTHSIYPAIIAHAVNNLVFLAEINLRTYTGIDWLEKDPSLWAVGGSLLLLGGGLALLRCYPPLLPLTPADPDSEPPALPASHPSPQP